MQRRTDRWDKFRERPIPADSEYSGDMAGEKRKPKAKEADVPRLDFETFVRAAMATGRPSAPKKKAAKRRPRKGGK